MARISNRSLIKYHRWFGLVAALFVVTLSVTGLLLQHTERLGLDRTYLKTDWLLEWYNYPIPELQQLELEQVHILQVDDKLLVNGRQFATSSGTLWGAAFNGETYLIGAGSELYWLSPDTQLIDSLASPIAHPIALAAEHGNFLLQGREGWLAADSELELWTPANSYRGAFALPKKIALEQATLPPELAIGISLERLLLDLHSGRLFGSIGVLVMDLAAMALILLALTGCWVWYRKR